MQDDKDKIKKFAGLVLSQFEAEPPADMWSRIELQTRRKKRLILFRYVAMAASVLLLLGVGFSLLVPGNDPDSKSKTISEKETPESKNLIRDSQKQSTSDFSGLSGAGLAKRPPIDSPGKQVEKNKFITSGQKSETERSMLAEKLQDTKPLQTEIKPSEPGLTEETIPDPVSVEGVDAIAVTSKVIEPDDIIDVSNMDIARLIPEPPSESLKKTGNIWSLAMGYGTTSAGEMAQQDASLKSSGSNYSYDGLTAEVANETSYFEEIESISHDAPLSLGFIISYQFSKRWYAETGLLYTRLGYQVNTSEQNNLYYQYGNELYYLGIPLGIRFAITERKRFGIFATQSAIIEKGLTSSSYINTYKQGVLSGSESNEAGIMGIQLSSLTGLGADVKIAGNLSAYGQAGIQLFFLNSTQPFNIRSARVAWPSFQVGLRMKLE